MLSELENGSRYRDGTVNGGLKHCSLSIPG